MRKIVLLFAGAFCSISVCAQIDSLGSFESSSPNSLRLIRTLSGAGPKLLDESGNDGFVLYDLDGSTHATVLYPEAPAGFLWSYQMGPAYVTEDLFDNDPTSIEFMCFAYDTANGPGGFAVLRDNGDLLFWRVGVALLPSISSPQEVLMASPWVFNTPSGARMVLRSIQTGEVTIYGLPGSLPCLACDGTLSAAEIALGEVPDLYPDGSSITAFPNPATTTSSILFGESTTAPVRAVQLFGAHGILVKSVPVPSGADRITLSVVDVAVGVYRYRLLTDRGEVPGNQLVVVH